MIKQSGNDLPLVSIGVPVYNGEPYLEECLNSIKNQSYSNWECIICNNSSTDRSPEIAEKFTRSDPRFRLFHTDELLPITQNWNFTFSRISGSSKYFKILPADDWIFPGFISEMVSIMEKYPEAGICSSYRLVDREIRSEGLDYYRGNCFPGKEVLIGELKRELNITSSINAVLYRMETLKTLDYYPEIFQEQVVHQDTFLSYEMLSKTDLGFVFQVLSYTRRHGGSVTSTVTERLNTRLFFWESVLFHYRNIDHSVMREYRKIRISYAYFMLGSRLKFKHDAIKWHRERLKRPIKYYEYLVAAVKRIGGKHI